MHRETLAKVVLLFYLSLCSCVREGPGPSDADGPTRLCGLFRDAGGRHAPICCGASTEIPGVSCVDLTQDGGQYGIYGHCIAAGDTFEGKIAPALCCTGLVFRMPEVSSTASPPDFPDGCAPDSTHYSPSEVLCLACGDGLCEPPENACDCPEDCSNATEAGVD